MRTFEERLADAKAFISAWRETDQPKPPSYLEDQLRAATEEAHNTSHRYAVAATTLLKETWKEYYNCEGEAELPLEVDARFLVAVTGPALCCHLRSGKPEPVVARLALHRLDCFRCAETVRRPPTGEDDRCDWCGKRGVTMFKPVGIQRGPVLAIGDACYECADHLIWVPRGTDG